MGAMLGPTRLQRLEKENRDLRVRLENRQGKAELLLLAAEEEAKALKAQLRDKDNIIAMLQREIHALTGELGEARSLRAETIQRRVDSEAAKAVAAATAPIMDELAKANEEIKRLKCIISRDSGNSSSPPSNDGFKKIPNNREPSKRAKGGQTGHPGHRLGLMGNIDELVEKGIVQRRIVDHTGGKGEYVTRYVIDVEVVTTITEHRYAKGARLPKNLYNEVSYGDNIKAMSVLLLSDGIIAEKRMSDIIGGLTQGAVMISPATLEGFQSQFADKLERGGELEAIKEDLLNGEVMHTDDTPMSCTEKVEYLEGGETAIRTAKNTSYNVTVRTHGNDSSTFYTANPQKNMEGVERDAILTKFFGTLSHDHEAKFYNYGTLHATCGDHLCRDLKGLVELEKIPWAGLMREHMLKMNRHKNSGLAKGRASCSPETLAIFENEYDGLIEQGLAELGKMRENELGYNKLNAMLNRLAKFKDCYLLFIRDYKAPFTNSLAERDIRMLKTKEKVSGSFRSWAGIKNYVKIRSFISTVKKRKMNLLSSIAQVVGGVPVLRRDSSDSGPESSAA